MGKGFVFGFLLALPLTILGGEEMDFYKMKTQSLSGEDVDLGMYKGKVLLVVNTASKCGYTPQYDGLQKLYESYKDKGLVVLGFPSNDFGGQEPGSAEEIRQFCQANYGVSFPMFAKTPVKGENKHPLYRFLTDAAPEKGEVRWNFEKFLLDGEGRVLARFRSGVKPMDEEIIKVIDSALQGS